MIKTKRLGRNSAKRYSVGIIADGRRKRRMPGAYPRTAPQRDCHFPPCALPLDFPPAPGVERPRSAAAHQEMKPPDRPEQRKFDAAAFPVLSEVEMVGDDRGDEEHDDRPRRESRQQAE